MARESRMILTKRQAMEIKLDPRGFMRVTVTGRPTYGGFVEAFGAITAHESFRRGLNVVWDFREAPLAAVPTETLRRIVRFAAERQETRRGARVAVAVASDADFGVARIFEALAADLPIEFRVFRNLEDAERWGAGPEPG